MVPDGWKEAALSEVCRKPISYGIVQAGESIKDGITCVRVVDLTKNEILVEEMITTSEEVNSAYQKTILEKDEIMIALRGEVGLARIVETNLVGSNLTRGIARISPKKDVADPVYLLWAIRSATFRADLMRRVGGSALQEIALGELRKVRTPIPPLPEQKKIARILSTWDRAIDVTEKLISNSQQQKKSLMQQLLTGKKRLPGFSGEWKYKSISEVAVRVQRKTDDKEHPILTISSLSGFVTQEERYSRYMAGESVKKYILLKRGEFAYNKGNSKTYQFGCIFDLDSFETGLVPHVYVCFKLNSDLSHNYFKYLFGADYLKPQLGALVNTGVRNNGLLNIKPSEFLNTKVPVPSIKEQERIASVLHALEQKIQTQQQKLECLRQEKKALMQQLLTGKRRVKVDDVDVAQKEVVRA